jgi:hypothetical protein
MLVKPGANAKLKNKITNKNKSQIATRLPGLKLSEPKPMFVCPARILQCWA